MDKVIELTYAIEFLARSAENLEEQCNRHYEISNLLVLAAQEIRREVSNEQ